MSNTDVESSRPYFEESVHHAKDEASHDRERAGPAERDQPVWHLDLAFRLVEVPADHHTWK